jgi:hypothetical protein
VAYELLRIFYSLWLGGMLLFALNAASNAVFSKHIERRHIKVILLLPLFVAAWPLALFSPNGRKVLFTKFNQL